MVRLLGAALAVLSALAFTPFTPRDWPALKASIRSSFPAVRHISIDALEQLRARTDVLLVDVRARDEFAMSHIAGARHADGEQALLALLASEPRDRDIVVYCSVGYRSGKLAQTLGERGFSKVSNLEGSLFEWANSGRPVVADTHSPAQGTRTVSVVHPFNRSWGKFLGKAHWPERW